MDDERSIVSMFIASRLLKAFRGSKKPPDSEEWFGFDSDKMMAILLLLTPIIYIVKELYNTWRRHRAQIIVENGGDEEHQRDRANLQKRIEGTLQERVHECPICLGEANFPVMTDCGHLFCCSCIIRYWKQSKTIFSPCDCAYCRCTFNKLLPIQWPIPGTSDEIDDQLQKSQEELDDYNRRFSINKTPLDTIRDIPVFLLDYIKNYYRNNRVDAARIVLVPICATVYECIYGKNDYFDILIFFDDCFLVIVSFVVLIRRFRRYWAERREANHQ